MGRHLWELRSGRHHSPKLQRSFAKHDESAFEFKILFVCDPEQLEFFETRAITGYDSYHNGYNVAAEAKGGFMRGRKWPEGTKAARIEEMRNRRASDETKARISEAKKAEWADPEAHERMAKSMRKPKSLEGAANIAAATARRYENPEARRKTAQATKDTWAARREKYGPTGRKPKNSSLVSDSEEVLYG